SIARATSAAPAIRRTSRPQCARRCGKGRVPETEAKPDFVTHFREGLAHFNNREFWEAHESWEALWLVAESDVEQFLQGLIQIAAAYHHLKRGTLRGAPRLFEAGLRRRAPCPPHICGVDHLHGQRP